MVRLGNLSWLAGVVVLSVVVLSGCGGGGEEGGGGPVFPTGTATLTGTVFAANSVAVGLGGALVTVVGTGQSVAADAAGAFRIPNLPSGQYTVDVQTPNQADYGGTSFKLTFTNGVTTTITVAVLPAGSAVPEQILMDPTNAVLDLNAKLHFRTQIVAADNVVIPNVKPTFIVTGGIGTISPDGVFTALSVGNGAVTALAGTISRQCTIQVTPPSPPKISSFQVNPTTIVASGGDIYMSALVSDGDGVNVADVSVQIFGPGDEETYVPTSVPNPQAAEACDNQAGCYTSATFATTFHAPANDNQPTQLGVQAPQNYTAKLVVTDRSGATTESGSIDFVVRGIDAPPPTPNL